MPPSREPIGQQISKTFHTKREAAAFLATMTAGSYISPHAGRVLFGDHTREWMRTWSTAATTTAPTPR